MSLDHKKIGLFISQLKKFRNKKNESFTNRQFTYLDSEILQETNLNC